jgi:hypothetical protein
MENGKGRGCNFAAATTRFLENLNDVKTTGGSSGRRVSAKLCRSIKVVRQGLVASLFAADNPPKPAPMMTTRGFRIARLGLTIIFS